MRLTDKKELIGKSCDFFDIEKIVLDDTLLGGKRSSGVHNLSFIVYRYDKPKKTSPVLKEVTPNIRKVFVVIDYGTVASEPLRKIISALTYEPKYQMLQENYILNGSLFNYICEHPKLIPYTNGLDLKDLSFTKPIIMEI